MIGQYILVGQTPVPCDDLLTWARWFEDNDARRVKETRVMDLCSVSTVFLGLDHRHVGGGPPLLFETMAFWPGRDGYEMTRCSTWMQAEAQHERMVQAVARPRAVWEYVRRAAREAIDRAREDWASAWRELRGIPEDEHEAVFRRMRERMAEVDFE